MTEKLTIEEKFEVGLNELISLCLDGGMHPRDFIDGLEAELKWARHDDILGSVGTAAALCRRRSAHRRPEPGN